MSRAQPIKNQRLLIQRAKEDEKVNEEFLVLGKCLKENGEGAARYQYDSRANGSGLTR